MGYREGVMRRVDMNPITIVQASILLRERTKGFALYMERSREACSLHQVKIMRSR